MWEYTGKMVQYLEDTMKEYKTEIAASIILPFTFGCAEAWQESYNELSKINDGNQNQQQVIVVRDNNLNNPFGDSIDELERIGEKAERDTQFINAWNQLTLYQKHLQRQNMKKKRQSK
jgi:hypothetical protein